VNKLPRRPILGKQSIARLRKNNEVVFSMSFAPSNSRNGVLCDQLLGYATVLTIELCFLCGPCRGYKKERNLLHVMIFISTEFLTIKRSLNLSLLWYRLCYLGENLCCYGHEMKVSVRYIITSTGKIVYFLVEKSTGKYPSVESIDDNHMLNFIQPEMIYFMVCNAVWFCKS
jgi:hypothetical protein